MTCPKCRGRLLTDQRGEMSCLNCGWRPPERIAGAIDLGTVHDRRRENAVGYQLQNHPKPAAWEFTE